MSRSPASGAAPSLDVSASGQVTTHPPKLSIEGFGFEFDGALRLLEQLQKAVDLVGKVPGVTATPSGVTAGFALPIPAVSCGAFSLSNLSFQSKVVVPFDGSPVTVGLGFASRDKPFSLTVLALGGGGYIDVQLSADGPRVEASLEFGAQLAVDFVVARGEVHALGGVRYTQQGAKIAISGYLRIGGSLEILSIVSVSVELRISLTYDTEPRPRLVGRATLVLEIGLTLWSDKIEIDSGEWVLAGGTEGLENAAEPSLLEDPFDALAAIDAPLDEAELEAWQNYRRSFTGAAV